MTPSQQSAANVFAAAVNNARIIEALNRVTVSDWNSEPTGVGKILAAGITYGSGPQGISTGEAPLPYEGESLDSYLDRVIGGDWRPGGGFNLTQPSTWGQAFSGASKALSDLGAAFGIAGVGQFVYLLSALGGNASPSALASAFKTDYASFSDAGDLAKAVSSGDWGSAWSVVTGDAQNLADLVNAFSPSPAPDEQGQLTITSTDVPAPSSEAAKVAPSYDSSLDEAALDNEALSRLTAAPLTVDYAADAAALARLTPAPPKTLWQLLTSFF